jgi:hypothetical protein
VCLHPSTQPTWPQLYACLFFCLLSFLHLPSPPVRFLGQACAGHKTHPSDSMVEPSQMPPSWIPILLWTAKAHRSASVLTALSPWSLSNHFPSGFCLPPLHAIRPFLFLFFLSFFMYFHVGLGLNSGLLPYKAGTLPFEPHLWSMLLWLFWKWGIENYLPSLAEVGPHLPLFMPHAYLP